MGTTTEVDDNDIYGQREQDGNGPVVAVCLQRGNIGTLGQCFEDWLEIFDLYLVANKTAEEKKKAIFLLKIGEELLTVYRSKRKADKSDTYDEIRKMLVAHVKPNTVVFTEVMGFRRVSGHEGTGDEGRQTVAR